MSMSDHAWLATLKAGDEVAFNHAWGAPTISKVTSVTATQIRIGASKYRRKDGYAVGGDKWSRTSLMEPTAEVRALIEEASLRRRLADFKLKDLPLEKVRAILAVLES